MTSETWQHLYDAQKWAEPDQWWRFSEDKAALSELFNRLVENIPKTAVENGTESVRQPTKTHLGLSFAHHDAGEDARAAAEVVLHAEAGHAGAIPQQEEDFDLIEDIQDPVFSEPIAVQMPSIGTIIGRPALTAGNLTHNHIYLRAFFAAFPKDAVGGSNAASAAAKTITIDWGGTNVAMTDLDGQKKFFRKRGWVREFFAMTGPKAGDVVAVYLVGPYSYRVSLS